MQNFNFHERWTHSGYDELLNEEKASFHKKEDRWKYSRRGEGTLGYGRTTEEKEFVKKEEYNKQIPKTKSQYRSNPKFKKNYVHKSSKDFNQGPWTHDKFSQFYSTEDSPKDSSYNQSNSYKNKKLHKENEFQTRQYPPFKQSYHHTNTGEDSTTYCEYKKKNPKARINPKNPMGGQVKNNFFIKTLRAVQPAKSNSNRNENKKINQEKIEDTLEILKEKRSSYSGSTAPDIENEVEEKDDQSKISAQEINSSVLHEPLKNIEEELKQNEEYTLEIVNRQFKNLSFDQIAAPSTCNNEFRPSLEENKNKECSKTGPFENCSELSNVNEAKIEDFSDNKIEKNSTKENESNLVLQKKEEEKNNPILLVMSINTENGPILFNVRRDDNPDEIAKNFCNSRQYPQEIASAIAYQIKSTLKLLSMNNQQNVPSFQAQPQVTEPMTQIPGNQFDGMSSFSTDFGASSSQEGVSLRYEDQDYMYSQGMREYFRNAPIQEDYIPSSSSMYDNSYRFGVSQAMNPREYPYRNEKMYFEGEEVGNHDQYIYNGEIEKDIQNVQNYINREIHHFCNIPERIMNLEEEKDEREYRKYEIKK